MRLDQLPSAIARDLANVRKRVQHSLERSAVRAEEPIKSRVPVAFGELRDSVQGHAHGRDDNPVTSVDAPHAADVEVGSPPHRPDFDKLLAWVKLRGMQGLTPKGRLRKRFTQNMGPTTPHQASRVAGMLRSMEVGGLYSPVDSPEQVAKAISDAIAKNGTRPHWFVQNSLPEIHDIVSDELAKQFR